MAFDDGNSVTTRLLTLLNVSATRGNKRKWIEEEPEPNVKLNKRSSSRVTFSSVEVSEERENKNKKAADSAAVDGDDGANVEEEGHAEEDDEQDQSNDPYEAHFGPKPIALTDNARNSVDRRELKTTRDQWGKLGNVLIDAPESSYSAIPSDRRLNILDRLKKPFEDRQRKLPKDQQVLQNDMLSFLTTQRDCYLTRTALETHSSVREAITLHALNHITRKRRRVLKNNERLSHASKSSLPPPEDVQDQGFTRPSVLVILPFRNSALNWINALISHTPRPDFQIENHTRFLNEFGLPQGAVDKLAQAEPGAYPQDHVETFKGNVDDSFRIGVKMTRKSVKLFSDFYGCDIILASPLGLRMSIEKEKSADFLSSIEILIVDQMDALTMQNWDHVQFVLSSLNKLPKESHDADFSRIKPWYLDGHAGYIRQSILLSAYETPETRSIYNHLKNVAGKIRTERRWAPIAVPEGVKQNFVPFDCTSVKDEPDKRFHFFTTQTLPNILKSAVQSANTVIFVPSSFDFIRVHNYFRKREDLSFTVLSEYSSNQDISRARQAFFSGKKSFLLISERFHFFRRYKIRGIRNVIFYGPPDHPQFYTEFLSYPFLDDGVEPSDVSCRVLYSRYDWFKLERIAGTEEAAVLIKRWER